MKQLVWRIKMIVTALALTAALVELKNEELNGAGAFILLAILACTTIKPGEDG